MTPPVGHIAARAGRLRYGVGRELTLSSGRKGQCKYRHLYPRCSGVAIHSQRLTQPVSV